MQGEALVVGGGIGGLASAAALLRRGWRVTVAEQAPSLGEVGSGLMVSSNATRLLAGWGVDLQTLGMPVRWGEGRSWRGASLGRYDAGAVTGRLGAPAVVAHRADLHAALHRAASGAELRLGLHAEAVEAVGARATVRFQSGVTLEADVVIGADGLRSAVRAALRGAEPLHYAGYPCWRGLTGELRHPSFEPGTLMEIQGRGARVGVCEYRPGRIYWWATADLPEGAPAPAEGHRAWLQRRFADWAPPVPQLLEATREADILKSDLYDRPPLAPPWGAGAVTLLGDAAHPMTPNLGQGACSAIEDAEVLAVALERAPDAASGLRAYERARAARTAQLQRRSRLFGAVGQWQNPVAVAAREALMRLTPARVMERATEEMWGWRVDPAGAGG